MQFIRFDSIHPFLEQVVPLLLQNEAVNNLPLGILNNLATATEEPKNPPFFGLVKEGHDILLMTLMTPPHNVVIYGESPRVEEALSVAITYLIANNVQIPGVIGPVELARRFADLWTERTNCEVKVAMEQRIYKLETVNPVRERSGQFRQATPADVPVVKDWIIAFHKESLQDEVPEEIAYKAAERGIQDGRYYLWVDPAPVSMAARIRPTSHGIAVGAVYTPPKSRNQGYASACVAALSQHLLDEGYQFTSLYTDLSNNTSNSIYMKIGYQPIADSVMLNFR